MSTIRCGRCKAEIPQTKKEFSLLLNDVSALIARVRELEGALENLVSVTDALADAANLNVADKQLTAARKALADKEV